MGFVGDFGVWEYLPGLEGPVAEGVFLDGGSGF